ncbi:MAG: hypothetical protein Q4F80_07520 [bacterium]|nr:hypothetical protein [bacterium]
MDLNIVKFLISVIIFLCGFVSLPVFAETDFQKIYDELEPADFEYIFGIDPYQAEDYTKYMFSPYPLLRTGVNFVFKETIIPPGYYLLTPRKYQGRTYVLFKEQGRVKYMIPCYNVDITTEEFYDEYIPKPRTTKWQSFKTKIADTVGTMFPEKTQRKPIPKSYMEINDIDGEFFQIILYYGTGKYFLVFKQEKE